MAQIQFYRGSSDKIDTTITPFKDGAVYFTPDDGGLYIDSSTDGENTRHHINKRELPEVTVADEWKFARVVGGEWASVTVPYDQEINSIKTSMTSPFNYKGEVSLASELPTENNEANDTYYVQEYKYRVTWTGEAWEQSSMDETDYTNELAALRSDLDDIRGATRNLWPFGDVEIPATKTSGDITLIFPEPLPAGTYTFSALVNSNAETTNSLLTFYNGRTIPANKVAQTTLQKGVRDGVTITTTGPADRVLLSTGNNSSTSAGKTGSWVDIQLESGTEQNDYIQHMTAVDLVAREKANENETAISSLSDVVSGVTASLDGISTSVETLEYADKNIVEETRNLWPFGDAVITEETSDGDVDFVFSEPLPAGTYTLSAMISSDSDSSVSKFTFYNGIGSPTNKVGEASLANDTGERVGKAVTLTGPATRVRFRSGTNTADSDGKAASWVDIQLETGARQTEYIPRLTAVDYVSRDLIDKTTEETRNLWPFGDVKITAASGMTMRILPKPLPAGDYMVSALPAIENEKATSAVFEFYNGQAGSGGVKVKAVTFKHGERGSKLAVLDSDADRVYVNAGTNSSTSAGGTGTWRDIQIEKGNKATEYVPHLTAVDYVARSTVIGFLDDPEDGKDYTADFQSILADRGVLRLGKGQWMISGLTMPENTAIIGSGNESVLVLDANATTHAVKMQSGCILSQLKIVGDGTFVPDGTITDRHGVYCDEVNVRMKIDNIEVTGFSGGGITFTDTGHGVDSNVECVNAHCYKNNVGVYLKSLTEFHNFTNVHCTDNYYGAIVNGGNNVFANCGFNSNDYMGVLFDNTDGTLSNTAMGAFVGCTFEHNGDNAGPNLKMVNMVGGETFTGCFFHYGSVELTKMYGCVFDACNFHTCNISLTNCWSGCNIFSNCISNSNSGVTMTLTNSNNTKVVNCWTRDGSAWA